MAQGATSEHDCPCWIPSLALRMFLMLLLPWVALPRRLLWHSGVPSPIPDCFCWICFFFLPGGRGGGSCQPWQGLLLRSCYPLGPVSLLHYHHLLVVTSFFFFFFLKQAGYSFFFPMLLWGKERLGARVSLQCHLFSLYRSMMARDGLRG